MASWTLRLAQLATILLAISGCGRSRLFVPPAEEAEDGGPDSSVGDAGSDGGTDSGRDAGGDAGFDAGEDGGVDGGVDGGLDAGRDSGVGTCDPHDAQEQICAQDMCDGPGTWHWNGDTCYPIGCGLCEGADCARGYGSRGDCMAAHAGCPATLCRQTGGAWLFWAQECGHYNCGRPVPQTCLIGFPVCDCGPDRVFTDEGCADAACPDPSDDPEALCFATGGTYGAFCCHSECGVPCPLACAAPACNCPPGTNFDDDLGCFADEACFIRDEGETCSPLSRCEEGTLCCATCGGVGCSQATCRAPTCDNDPATDICGNNILAP